MIRPQLDLLCTAFNKEQVATLIHDLTESNSPQFVLSGRSNVGKSSLVNALAGRKALAKISSTPGKTRSVNAYEVLKQGFCLVDLPGYGYAKCSHQERDHWARLIDYYFQKAPNLVAIILLLDCRVPPQDLDKNLAFFAMDQRIPLLPVLTKADKCTLQEKHAKQRQWEAILGGITPLPVSIKDSKSIETLWKALYDRIDTWKASAEQAKS